MCASFGDAQFKRKLGGELLEQTVSRFGDDGLEKSIKIIKESFDSESRDRLLKQSDDIITKLGSAIAENRKLKELLANDKNALKIWLSISNTKSANNSDIVKFFADVMTESGETAFYKKYLFIESGDILLINNPNGKRVAALDGNVLTAAPWKGEKDLNPLLNEIKMIPNSVYKVRGQSYIIKNDGLYKQISGVLTGLPKNKPLRSKEMQGLSKTVKDGIPVVVKGQTLRVKAGYPVFKDEGGHLIANRFGGGSEMYNYIPMSKKLNRSGGAWNSMENEWERSLKRGSKVDYKIQPIYKTNSKRPDELIVTYTIDGKRTTKYFDNNVF